MQRTVFTAMMAAVCLLVFVACDDSSNSCPDGQENCPCVKGKTCDTGLTCDTQADVCVAEGGSDADSDSDTDSDTDSDSDTDTDTDADADADGDPAICDPFHLFVRDAAVKNDGTREAKWCRPTLTCDNPVDGQCPMTVTLTPGTSDCAVTMEGNGSLYRIPLTVHGSQPPIEFDDGAYLNRFYTEGDYFVQEKVGFGKGEFIACN